MRILSIYLLVGQGCAEPQEEDGVERCEITLPEEGALHTSGTEILDGHGRVISLRGINTGGRAKFAPYTPFEFEDSGFDQALDIYLDRAESWGFSVLRVPFSWAAAEPAPGEWDEDYLSRYDALLDAAWERGIWTIVDFHQDIYAERYCGDGFPDWTLEGEGEPRHDCSTWFMSYTGDDDVRAAFDAFWSDSTGVQTAFAAMWKVMAARHADRRGVIGFEIINEPHSGNLDAQDWATETMPAFYTTMAQIIQAEAPDALVFFDSTGVDATLAETSLERPDGENLVFAPHYYDPGALFNWSLSADVGESLGRWAALGEEWDLPVLIGEFGVNGTHEDREVYIQAHYESFEALGLHATIWEYSESSELWNEEDLSMLDATGEERAELLDIVARPVVRSLAGTGAQVSYSTESRALSLHYRPTLDLPTEIIIPQWSHGEDLEALEIQVQGACIDFQGNRLLLQAQEDAAEITLMLSP